MSITAKHRYRGVDGQWHQILARGIPVRDERGNITHWAGINLDISELKRTEEQLRAAKEAAEQATEAKDRFLAVLSHELRTPLTPVLVATQMLERRDDLPTNVRNFSKETLDLKLG